MEKLTKLQKLASPIQDLILRGDRKYPSEVAMEGLPIQVQITIAR